MVPGCCCSWGSVLQPGMPQSALRCAARETGPPACLRSHFSLLPGRACADQEGRGGQPGGHFICAPACTLLPPRFLDDAPRRSKKAGRTARRPPSTASAWAWRWQRTATPRRRFPCWRRGSAWLWTTTTARCTCSRISCVIRSFKLNSERRGSASLWTITTASFCAPMEMPLCRIMINGKTTGVCVQRHHWDVSTPATYSGVRLADWRLLAVCGCCYPPFTVLACALIDPAPSPFFIPSLRLASWRE